MLAPAPCCCNRFSRWYVVRRAREVDPLRDLKRGVLGVLVVAKTTRTGAVPNGVKQAWSLKIRVRVMVRIQWRFVYMYLYLE